MTEILVGSDDKLSFTKKDSKILDKIVGTIKKETVTLEDVENNSAIYLVLNDGSISKFKAAGSTINSELGDMMINSHVNAAVKAGLKVKMIVKAFFAKGIIATEDSQELPDDFVKDATKGAVELSEKYSDLVKDMMVLEVHNPKFLSLNVYEFISSEDKKEDKTYVCISNDKIVERFINYSENSQKTNYFKK